MLKKIMEYYSYSILFIICFFIIQKYALWDMSDYMIIPVLILCIYGYKKNIKSINSANDKRIPKQVINLNYILILILSISFFIHISITLFLFDFFILVTILQIVLSFISKDKLEKFYEWSNSIIYEQKSTQEKECKKKVLTCFIAGFLFVLGGLIYLEIFNQNYFFIQDDNFHQFMPTIIQACRDLFDNGLFPEINPYQAGGLPTSSCGIYSLTYPLTYISYAIARYILNNEYFTIDVFSFIHLLFGYILTFIAGCKCNLRSKYSALYAICYSLSGYSLVAIRSWYYMGGIIAFAPLIILLFQHFRNANSIKLKDILIYGFFFGLIALAGNIQMWVYLFIYGFVLGIALLFLKELNLNKFFNYLLIWFLGLITALPQIYVTFTVFQNINRTIYYGIDTTYAKISYIIPLYILKHFTVLSPNFTEYRGPIYYSGSAGLIFVCAFLCILLVLILNNRYNISIKNILKDNIYLIPGILAFVLSLGHNAHLWTLLHAIGPLKFFQHPIKMIVFINLFLLLAGFIVVNRWIKSKKANIILIIITLLLICFHLVNLKQSFCKYIVNTYENANNVITDEMDLKNYRIFPWVSARYGKYEHPALTMGLNFPTIYKISSLASYNDNFEDNMRENKYIKEKNRSIRKGKNHFDYLREYGVKYIFVYLNTQEEQMMAENILKENNCKEIKTYDKISVFELNNSKPLAYIDGSSLPIPIKFNSQGFNVYTKGKNEGKNLVINMTWFPQYKAYAENKELDISHDSNYRIIIRTPKNAKNITFKYKSPWDKGFYLMLFFLIIFSILYYINERFIKNE